MAASALSPHDYFEFHSHGLMPLHSPLASPLTLSSTCITGVQLDSNITSATAGSPLQLMTTTMTDMHTLAGTLTLNNEQRYPMA